MLKRKKSICILVMCMCLVFGNIVANAAECFVYLSTTKTSAQVSTANAIGLSKVCTFEGGNSSASNATVYMYGKAAKPGSSFTTVKTVTLYPGNQGKATTYNASDGIKRNYIVALQTANSVTGCSASASAYY